MNANSNRSDTSKQRLFWGLGMTTLALATAIAVAGTLLATREWRAADYPGANAPICATQPLPWGAGAM